MKLLNKNKTFGGEHQQWSHHSETLNCEMRFAIFLPPQALAGEKVPALYWLSGLTCSDENFMQKAGAMRVAAELGMAIIAPDTSPRGDDVSDDENKAYDLGLGAGFYLNATQEPWKKHYQMYDYIVTELPDLIEKNFSIGTDKQQRSISGHSMGGHGALTIALKNPQRYTSVSAFSPICNPTQSPWGQKAFTAYLGEDKSSWEEYDASLLMQKTTSGEPAKALPILIDQGLSDDFLEKELRPDTLEQAAQASGYPLELRKQAGYDHSYYFIATFIEEHLRFHAKHLKF